MEIVYLWIDKYKSIEKKGFHFNNDLIVEITAIDNSVIKGSIKRSLKSHKYKLFDNAITNFTAIVGANGSGKSSLIEFIFNEVKTDHSNYAYFLIGKNVKNQYILYNHIIGYNFDNPSKIEFIITDDDDKIEFKFDKIFYSNFFDFNTS